MSPFEGRHGPFLIAEIGGNHEGDFDYAVQLTRLAASSGADAIKFQIYTGDSLVNRRVSPDRHAHFGRFELRPAQYLELAELCRELGSEFLASVWDPDALAWIDPHLRMYKVGSGDLTAQPLLHRIAETGKPIVLSTGLARLDEVEEAVDDLCTFAPAYRTERKLALLQCTSMYPIPDDEANLHVMASLSGATGLPVGYSDHTTGRLALETAVAMGAELLEFHFTDTREGKEFRDHKVSLTAGEVRSLIERIGEIRAVQGSAEKLPTRSELENDHVKSFRRAVYPSKDLPIGHVLTERDLVVLRPHEGIGAEHFARLLGRKTRVALEALEPLDWEKLD